MTETSDISRDDLLTEIDQSWTALNTALDGLSAEQLTGPRDAAGWSVIDHVNHMAAWENSIIAMLQGQPRHEALGMTEGLYLDGDFDTQNAVIQQNMAGLTADEALTNLRAVHVELMGRVATMSDADLKLPYRHFLPDEPGKDDGPTAVALIRGDTSEHFNEHLAWIMQLVAEPS